MNSIYSSTKTAVSTALIALVLGLSPAVHAQTPGGATGTGGAGFGSGGFSAGGNGGISSPFLDTITNLRSIRSQTTNFDSSTGAPSTPYQGSPACNQNVMQSMQDSANFTASQAVAVVVNTLQMPASFASCLNDLLSQAETLNNAFQQMPSFNISAIFTKALDDKMQKSLTTMATKACSKAQAEIKSASGSIGPVKLDFSQLGKGGPVMLSVPGATSNTGFISSVGGSIQP